MQHVVQEHMANLLPKMQKVLPQNVDNEWNEMLLNCPWKPLDVSAAIGGPLSLAPIHLFYFIPNWNLEFPKELSLLCSFSSIVE